MNMPVGGMPGYGLGQTTGSQDLYAFLSLLFENLANGQTDPAHRHGHKHGPVYAPAGWHRPAGQNAGCGSTYPPSSGSQTDDCGGSGGNGGQTTTVDGTISWEGDPHGHVQVTVNGQTRDLSFDTSGTGLARMFDSDMLDVDAQLEGEPNKTYDRADTITVINSQGEKVVIKVDAKTDKVTVDNQDLNGTYNQYGITVKKEGSKTTVTMADGTKVTVNDKGDHLDTQIEMHNMKTHELGGVFGTAARTGTKDGDITHFPAKDHHNTGGSATAVSYNYADYNQRDAQWAYGVCASMANRFPDGHFMRTLFSTLAQFFGNSSYGDSQMLRA